MSEVGCMRVRVIMGFIIAIMAPGIASADRDAGDIMADPEETNAEVEVMLAKPGGGSKAERDRLRRKLEALVAEGEAHQRQIVQQVGKAIRDLGRGLAVELESIAAVILLEGAGKVESAVTCDDPVIEAARLDHRACGKPRNPTMELAAADMEHRDRFDAAAARLGCPTLRSFRS